MEHWQLEARESIRDLVARYNANGDSGRVEQVLDLFADDGVLEVVPHRTYRGRAEIRELLEDASGDPSAPAVRMLRHYTATLQIEVHAEDRAESRCYYAVLTETGLDHWGRYLDQYGLEEGRWRFVYRRVTLDGTAPNSWAERTMKRLYG